MKAFVTSSTAAALTVATLMHGHLVPSVMADGGDYYDGDYEYDRDDGYGGGGVSSAINPLAAVIAPLAALALLGAATAVALNPVLVSLAVITGKKKRKRRSVITADQDDLDPKSKRQLEEMQKLETFLAKVPNGQDQTEELLANYVDCSGLAANSQCLEHLVCLYSNPLASSAAANHQPVTDAEKDVIAIILYNLLGNKYIGEDVKQKLRVAARQSKTGGSKWCAVYKCPLIEPPSNHGNDNNNHFYHKQIQASLDHIDM